MAAVIGMQVCVRRSFLLLFILFYFLFCFQILAPIQQIGADYDAIFFEGSYLIVASLIVLFSTASAIGFVTLRCFSAPKLFTSWDTSILEIKAPNTLVLIILSCLSSFFLISVYGATLFATRGGRVDEMSFDYNKGSMILISGILEPFTFVSATIGITICWRKRDKSGLFFIFPFVLSCAINNPASQSRFESSCIALFAILLWYGYSRVRLVAGFLYLGVALSPIYNTFFRNRLFGSDERTFMQFFVHMDYEAVNLLCYSMKWTEQAGFEWGRNYSLQCFSSSRGVSGPTKDYIQRRLFLTFWLRRAV